MDFAGAYLGELRWDKYYLPPAALSPPSPSTAISPSPLASPSPPDSIPINSMASSLPSSDLFQAVDIEGSTVAAADTQSEVTTIEKVEEKGEVSERKGLDEEKVSEEEQTKKDEEERLREEERARANEAHDVIPYAERLEICESIPVDPPSTIGMHLSVSVCLCLLLSSANLFESHILMSILSSTQIALSSPRISGECLIRLIFLGQASTPGCGSCCCPTISTTLPH
jgi:hypothetical protein